MKRTVTIALWLAITASTFAQDQFHTHTLSNGFWWKQSAMTLDTKASYLVGMADMRRTFCSDSQNENAQICTLASLTAISAEELIRRVDAIYTAPNNMHITIVDAINVARMQAANYNERAVDEALREARSR